MTQLQRGETWYKSGPYGHGILEEHFDLTAKTAHSNGPIFGAIYLTHMSEEARRMADARATLAASAPELLEALQDAANQLRTIAAIVNQLPRKYAAQISPMIRYGDIDDVIAKARGER